MCDLLNDQTNNRVVQLYPTIHYCNTQRYQISRKKRLVYLYLNLREKYQFKLACSSFFTWKGYHILSVQRRRVLSKVIRRRFLFRWNQIANKIRVKQRTILKIIIYRWWLFTENRKERRKVNRMARNHWSRYRYRSVITAWRSITIREQGHIRTPKFLRRRECRVIETHEDNPLGSQRLTLDKQLSCKVRNLNYRNYSSIDYRKWSTKKDPLAFESPTSLPRLSIPFQMSTSIESLEKNFSLGPPIPLSGNFPFKHQRFQDPSTIRSTISSRRMINKISNFRDLDESYREIGEKKLIFDNRHPKYHDFSSTRSNQNPSGQTKRSCFQSEESFSKASRKLYWIDEAMSKADHLAEYTRPYQKSTIAEEKLTKCTANFQFGDSCKTAKGVNQFPVRWNAIGAEKERQ